MIDRTHTNGRLFRLALLSALGLGLSACASPLPKDLQRAPPDNPRLEQVQSRPEGFAGRFVRWGGEIIEVRNARDHSDLLILARPLSDAGKPRSGSAAEGRFVGRVAGFVDPADYLDGQRVTVFGRLDGAIDDAVGDYVYRYPVVSVQDWYRWPPQRSISHRPWWYEDSFYRGPFYDPWWPSRYGWPYHRPYW
jgi:outer membrane lipoprotein